MLRQLALKKKFDENPFLAQTKRFITKDEALLMGEDPHFNDLGMTTLTSNIYPKKIYPH